MKWHAVFEGELLIKITTISMLFVLYCTGVLIKNVVLIEEIRYGAKGNCCTKHVYVGSAIALDKSCMQQILCK